jgi:hypothetical protein
VVRAVDECLCAVRVDELQGAAGPGGESDAIDGSEVGVGDGGEDALVEDACGFQRLNEQQPVADVLFGHFGIVRSGPAFGQAGPECLGAAVRRVVVEASEVFPPRMISTSGMRCTGEKKCRPMTRPGSGTEPARPVMGRVEVLEAITASGRAEVSAAARTAVFTAR